MMQLDEHYRAPSEHLVPGFADPVHDAQQTFRATLAALSRPGCVVDLCRAEGPCLPSLSPALSALLLCLSDATTPIWWEQTNDAAAQALAFHRGAPIAQQRHQAQFAVLAQGAAWPDLAQWACGSEASPEESATLLVEVSSLGVAGGWRCSGPGVDGVQRLHVAGLPAAFLDQWRHNARLFPRGVDMVLVHGHRAVGLPRTTKLEA